MQVCQNLDYYQLYFCGLYAYFVACMLKEGKKKHNDTYLSFWPHSSLANIVQPRWPCLPEPFIKGGQILMSIAAEYYAVLVFPTAFLWKLVCTKTQHYHYCCSFSTRTPSFKIGITVSPGPFSMSPMYCSQLPSEKELQQYMQKRNDHLSQFGCVSISRKLSI